MEGVGWRGGRGVGESNLGYYHVFLIISEFYGARGADADASFEV